MEFLRKYGVAATINIPLIIAGSNNQATQNNSPVDYIPVAGDVKISKDEGAAANITTLPTAVAMGNGAFWKISLSATEMQAARIVITISDSATKAIEDQQIDIATYGNASAEHAFDLDTATVTVGTNNDKTGYSLTQAFPTNFSSMVISAGGAVDSLVQGFLNSLITEATVGRIATNFDTLFENGDVAATLTLDAIALAAAVATAAELAKVPKSDGTSTWNATALASIQSEANDALVAFFTSAAALVDLFWNELAAGHTTAGSFGKIIKNFTDIVQLDGTVTDAGPLVTDFDTDLTGYGDTYFDDAILVFTDAAANKGIGKPVSGYTSLSGNFQFLAPDDWPNTPVNGDPFVIYAIHVHPVSQIRDAILADSTPFNGADIPLILEDTGTTIQAQIAALNDPTAAAVAAAVYSYNMGNGRTIGEALAFLRNKWEITGSPATLVVYDTNDTTALWSSVLVKTAGDPVSSSDPV